MHDQEYRCGYGCSQRIDYSTVARETGGCGYGRGQLCSIS